MQNWTEVIKQAEEKKMISPKEAEDLRDELKFLKTASLADISKRIFTGIKGKAVEVGSKAIGFGERALKHPEKPLLVLVGAGTAAEVGGALAKPFKASMQYKSMKKQLERIAPDITSKFNDKHIRVVYDSMADLAPAVAHNPLVSAILVRDNINLPDNINYANLKGLSEIQRNVASTQIKSPGVIKQVRGKLLASAMSGSAISDAAKSIAGVS